MIKSFWSSNDKSYILVMKRPGLCIIQAPFEIKTLPYPASSRKWAVSKGMWSASALSWPVVPSLTSNCSSLKWERKARLSQANKQLYWVSCACGLIFDWSVTDSSYPKHGLFWLPQKVLTLHLHMWENTVLPKLQAHRLSFLHGPSHCIWNGEMPWNGMGLSTH